MIKEERPYPVLNCERHQIGRISVIKDTILLNGHEHPFTYVEYQDSVCVLALHEGKVIAIEQYRHTLNSWELELPCGGVEKGETPMQAAARELKEETGFRAGELIFLGKYHTNQGYSSCVCEIYFTQCAALGRPAQDETELIRIRPIPVDQFDTMVRDGTFRLLIGIAAWQRAKACGLVGKEEDHIEKSNASGGSRDHSEL